MRKQAVFQLEQGQVTVTVGFREVFDAALRRQLRSGFTTTLVVRLWVKPLGSRKVVSVAARTVQAVYDLWDDAFFVTSDDGRGRQLQRLGSARQVVDRMTGLWRFPLVPTARLEPNRRYVMAAAVEVNPMSPEVLSEVRRWLRQPYRRQRGATRESFFGSLVSVFVNDKVRRAEKLFSFQSQPFSSP